METQKKLIEKRNWDYLIILDACRYDYFKDVYEKYLRGNLSKVYSGGAATSEWLRKTFCDKDFEDVIYVSANPHINSKGIEVVEGLNAEERFFKVVDVWDYGWSDNLGTIHPQTVTKAVKSITSDFPNKKIIAHYAQPHAPYLAANISTPYRFKILNRFFAKTRREPSVFFDNKEEKADKGKRLDSKLKNYIPTEVLPAIRKIFGFPLSPLQMFKIGVLIKNYRINLRLAIKALTDFSRIGKTIISSDHGELLGESFSKQIPEKIKKQIRIYKDRNRKYLIGHAPKLNHPSLREVPWFTLEGTKEDHE